MKLLIFILIFYALDCNVLAAQSTDTTVYTIVEEMPRFSHCDDTTAKSYQQLKTCSNQALLKYLYNNLDFPKFDLNEIWTDRIVLSFIIQPSGKVDSIKIIKGIHPIPDTAVVRLFETMPPWIPGQHHGQPVAVRRLIPIRIRFHK